MAVDLSVLEEARLNYLGKGLIIEIFVVIKNSPRLFESLFKSLPVLWLLTIYNVDRIDHCTNPL